MKPNSFYAYAKGDDIELSIWGQNPEEDGNFKLSPAQALRLAEMLTRAAREQVEAEEDAAAT